jgi:hypothetical protein
MNLPLYASKLLTNKYVLYFVVFLAASNVLGYMMIGQLNTVMFFALTAFITSYFSRNMIVILLVALMITNLLISGKIIKEGLENKDDPSTDIIDTTYEEEKLADIDEELKRGIDVLKQTKGNVTEAKEILENSTSNQGN